MYRTGREVHLIEACLDACLSFAINKLSMLLCNGEKLSDDAFAEAVCDSMIAGYARRGVRACLDGTISAEQLVILGQESGACVQSDQIARLDLVSKEVHQKVLTLLGNDECKLPRVRDILISTGMSKKIGQQLRTAWQRGNTLQFVGELRIAPNTTVAGKVGLREISRQHPLAMPTDKSPASYCVLLHTHALNQEPLVVRGPAGGDDNIGSALFADLLRLTDRLGARDHSGQF